MTDQPYDLNHGPLEISQDRGKLALGVLSAAVFVGLGFWLLSGDIHDGRAPFAGWLAILVFVPVGLLNLVRLLRPSRLSIAPDGLTLREVLRMRRWPWRNLEDLYLGRVRGTFVITMRTAKEPSLLGFAYPLMGLQGNAGLPGAWPISGEALFKLISEGRSRWG